MPAPSHAVASGPVNENHAKLLGTAEWAAHLHEDILPAVTDGVDLGDDLLEIGPGPGAASEWLRHRVRRLVALELDPAAAAALRDRFSGTNVECLLGLLKRATNPASWPLKTLRRKRAAMRV